MAQKQFNYLIITSLIVGLCCLFTISCEKDDVCINTPITPQVQIVFEDAENNNPNEPLRKRVVGLLVRKIPSNSLIDKILLNSASTDSISVPLNVNTDSVIYEFVENFGADDESIIRTNTIEFTYERNNIYVNRACGFKAEFSNLAIVDDIDTADDNKWINRIEIENITVNNEEKRHITIFH